MNSVINSTKIIYQLLILALFCAQVDGFAHEKNISFSENKGQWDSNVAFKADLDGGILFVENNCFTYHFFDKDALRFNHINPSGKPKPINRHAFRINFLESNKNVNFTKAVKSKSHKNYFIGNNQSKWQSNVYSYAKITCKNLYNGIDMETEGIENAIKYQFNVAANADIDGIKLSVEGVEKIWIKNGEIHIKTSVNELVDQAPIAWQIINDKKVFIPCSYVLENNIISFKLSKKYNKNYPLVIDPILVFGSYTGSTADNFGLTATYDRHGNLYTGGLVYNVGYPTTLGAFDSSYNGIVLPGRTDISISKFDSTGATLIYSTYLGGADNTEVVHSMVVNGSDELCLFGTTGSNDFPTTTGAYSQTFLGGTYFVAGSNGTSFENGTDMYVTRFNNTGSQLIASTFIGGTSNDGVNVSAPLNFNYGDYFRGEINVDGNDNIIVGAGTTSADFPVTANAIQSNLNNQSDGVIFKFNPTLNSLLYSSYIGGDGEDAVYAIAVSGTNVYVTGGTTSSNLPTSTGTYNPTFGGGQADGFVAKISTITNNPPTLTYIATPSYEQSFFVQLDGQQNVYLYGQTNSPAFPYIGGVYQNANSGLFILKLDSLLSTAQFSTTFGNGNGTPNLSPSAFLVDNCEHIYISGWGGNILTSVPTYDMPLTANAFQSSTDGFNFYLAVFEHNMDSLIYGTYFGGPQSREHVDGGTSRFDKNGIVYQSVCAGCNSNDDFPTTPGAWSNTNNSSNCNNGVFKFDFEIDLVSADFTASPLAGCAPLTVNFTNLSNGNFLWDFGNNDTTSLVLNPIRTFNNPGVYPVKLIISSASSCNLADTIVRYITVMQGFTADFTTSVLPCQNTVNFSDLSSAISPSITSWQWNFGDGQSSTLQNPNHTFSGSGTYTVQLTVSDSMGCTGVIDTTITLSAITANPVIVSNCGNNNVVFNALPNNAGAYYWSFGNQNNTSTLQQTNYLYPDTGLYNAYLVVYWGNTNECSDTAFINVPINPAFIASFSTNQDSCSNAVRFTETSTNTGNPSTQWQWIFGDGQSATNQNPTNTYAAGNYTATLIATAANGCIDTVKTQVSIKQFAPYSVSADTLLCAVPVNITLHANGGDFYLWSPFNQFINPQQPNQLVTIIDNAVFNVLIGRVNNEGDTCRVAYSTTVSVSAIGAMSFTAAAENDTIFEGESTPINVVASAGNFNFQWSPSAGLNNPNTDHVIASPSASTIYTLTVSEGACSRTAEVPIVVFKADCSESSIYVPNTFTPNDDGKNDKLFVRGNYISALYFAVYNRWGEKVFESNDKKLGWDGYYQGNASDPGVFGWYLKATCKDGVTTEMKGNVTLIR